MTATCKPSPVNFAAGIWREDDPAARCAIRRAYRRHRRYGATVDDARLGAKDAALAIADYNARRTA